MTVVASEVVGYEQRKKRNDSYDEECQIKVKESNKSQIKVLYRRMRMSTENYKYRSTENYKYRGRESKKMCTANKAKKKPLTFSNFSPYSYLHIHSSHK
jgi:excinuclease UvrABC ATPase subunit